MPLKRDQILSIDDLPRETVPVPEWGDEVIVKTLTGIERAQMIDRFVLASQSNPDELFNMHLIAACLVDESGVPLFDGSPEDIRILASRNGAVIERLFLVARRLNGYDRDVLKKSLKTTRS